MIINYIINKENIKTIMKKKNIKIINTKFHMKGMKFNSNINHKHTLAYNSILFYKK